ncbi:hypothetical protein HDU91_001728, partial [Kappamyces sp. JEL0680]
MNDKTFAEWLVAALIVRILSLYKKDMTLAAFKAALDAAGASALPNSLLASIHRLCTTLIPNGAEGRLTVGVPKKKKKKKNKEKAASEWADHPGEDLNYKTALFPGLAAKDDPDRIKKMMEQELRDEQELEKLQKKRKFQEEREDTHG